MICIVLCLSVGAFSFAQHEDYKRIQINKHLQTVLNDSIGKKIINQLDLLFLQIAKGSIDENIISKPHKDLTIAVLNGLQGIKRFSNRSDSLNHYQKQLIKFYPISEHVYSVSIAILNTNTKGEPRTLKTILRLIAEDDNGLITLSIPLKYMTRNWKSKKVGNITYVYSDTIQLERAHKFNTKNTIMSKKLNVPTEQFKFYMCENYQEILRLLGYEYQLESASTYKLGYGVEEGYIFSIMNNEDFSHDVFHYYSGKIHVAKNRNWIAEEGIACSWGNAYYVDKHGEMIELNRLVGELKAYLLKHNDKDLLGLFENNTKIFNHIDSDLSVRTVISGVICNEIEHKKGIDGILSIINSGRIPNSMDAYFKVLDALLGINTSTFNIEVWKLLENY
ncbi:hypothetical protein [Winogradskyella flava]|uniref:Uncharacterized protein n=1 Tax=Winogradskyella flava TaxID=1884876 RepID=A0A842ITA6_9FLAO|nr:hypothetical protein [Winogradskyella flava]MBC2845094.1 hypothetical protein [Winogradskyella flava]